MKEKLERIERSWADAFKAAAKVIEDKEATLSAKALALAEVRQAIVKGRSTSGVILAGREMELALQKLDECMMWIRNAGQKSVIQRRLKESAMWAKAGLSEQKAA